jgi:hypothetical protein
MPEYQTLKITFPLALSQDQEDVFIRSFQLTRDQVLNNLKKQKKVTGNKFYQWSGGPTALMMDNFVTNAIEDIDKLLLLEKDDKEPRTYYFRVASGSFDYARRFPLKIQNPGPMYEKLFMEMKHHLAREVYPRIAVEYERVEYEVIK